VSALRPLPKWADIVLLPLLNLLLALIVSGLVVVAIGQDPIAALRAIVVGAFGNGYNIGYTLYYTTNFIFAGLAFAIAAHAGLFNIGGNGQAYIAGLGVIAVAIPMQHFPWWATLPVSVLAAAAVGGLWGFIPGWLQAKRGSHVVITTIMFNFIAAAIMVYMVVNVLKPPGILAPESAMIAAEGRMPKIGSFIPWFRNTDLNFTLVLAVLCLIGVYLLIWHTRFGFGLRAIGHSASAARYAGISNSRTIMIVMTLSGALAGMIAVNQIIGVQYRLVLDFVAEAGFVGIAVSLMGRNHPIGIAFAAVLFGALYQGGNELQFVIPSLSKEMVVVIQALVILFTGAMEGMLRPGLQFAFSLSSAGPRKDRLEEEAASSGS
jgi:simple sugar transport system permease protein